MSDPLRRLLFPLTSLRLRNVFSAGSSGLDLDVARKGGRYASTVLKDGKPLKLSLEKIEQDEFTQALLQFYFFRETDREYGAHRLLLARFGLHNKEPLVMQYVDQKYILKLQMQYRSAPLGLHLFYSPSLGQIITRADRAVLR